jgi:hypothetical protein
MKDIRRGSHPSKRQRGTDKLRITVNYGLSVVDVYLQFARDLLNGMRAEPFDLLHRAGAFRPQSVSTYDLPSWVPDWSVPRLYESISGFRAGEDLFCSRRSQSIENMVPEQSLLMHLDGWVFSKISSISCVTPKDLPFQELKKLVQEWWTLCKLMIAHMYPSATLDEHLDFFADILSAGRIGCSKWVEKNGKEAWQDNAEGSCSYKGEEAWYKGKVDNCASVHLIDALLDGLQFQCRCETAKSDSQGVEKNLYTEALMRVSDTHIPLTEESANYLKQPAAYPIQQMTKAAFTSKMKQYIEEITRVMTGRFVFRTENYHFGICPGDAK